MNAINHAATALLVIRKWPGVPIIPVLLAVQLVELFWVAVTVVIGARIRLPAAAVEIAIP